MIYMEDWGSWFSPSILPTGIRRSFRVLSYHFFLVISFFFFIFFIQTLSGFFLQVRISLLVAVPSYNNLNFIKIPKNPFHCHTFTIFTIYNLHFLMWENFNFTLYYRSVYSFMYHWWYTFFLFTFWISFES